MSFEFIWQLPTRGDARYADSTRRLRGERSHAERTPLREGVSDPRGSAFNYFDYLHQVARAAELARFDGIRIQHDPLGDESWIVAGYVARATRSLKLVTEFEAAWGSAVYAAKNAVSVQRYTGGRFAWQISPGPSEAVRRRHADPVADADVLARIDEFLTVARGVLTSAPFDFKGRFFEVQAGGFRGTLANHPVPVVYLSGDSQEAFELSARHADVHVLSADGASKLESQIATLRALADAHADERGGRPLTIGLRVDVLARESESEARFDAERYAKQQRPGTDARTSTDADGLWRGLTEDQTGARATLVGSYEQVTERLASYAALGITSFLLGGAPHLEEAYRLGAHVLPQTRRRLSASQAAA